MGIPGSANPMLLGGVQQYQVERSLRFDGGAYLYRTPASAGNRRTSTFSCWFKWVSTGGEGVFLWASGRTKLAIDGGGFDEVQFDDYDGSYNIRKATSQSLRDPSAWYHLMVVMDTTNATAEDRQRLYLNGQRITAFSISTNPSQNFDTDWNNNVQHRIGADNNPFYFRGYMAECYMIDGTALDPSSFGKTDTITGAWIPKKYSGSYGTNGFYLKFDPSATNGIGHDHSGNGNNFTATGFSTSSSTYNINNDVVFDTPTNNHATWLPGKSDAFMPGQAQAFSDYRQNGNLYGNTGRNSPNSIFSSIPFPDNAKTYVEVYINDVGGGGGPLSPGVSIGCDLNGYGPYIYGSGNYNQDTAAAYSGYDGAFTWNGGSGTSNGGAYGASTLIGIAVDTTTSSPTISFYKNGTLVGTGTVGSNYRKSLVVRIDPVTGSSTAVGAYINAGQYAFNNLPTGYKALNTANLPEPTIKKGGAHFNTVLYTGTGSAQSISGVGFQPDLVWSKGRSIATNHHLFDAIRGVYKELNSNGTNAEGTDVQLLTAFNSDGFSLGTNSGVNNNGTTFVSWNWKANGAGSSNTAGTITSTVSANATAGFSIVTYTGTLANATVGHGLGVAPSMIICKQRSAANDWIVFHSALGNTGRLKLNTDDANSTSSTFWNSTSPTSTVFSLGTSNLGNNTGTYAAYCFSEVAGYSKFGSYVGNGSTDGPFVFCNFRPAWIMIKDSTGSGNSWYISDSKRNTYNVVNGRLMANLSNDESTSVSICDFTSNGFKIRTSDSGWNTSSSTYVFAAFAELSFKYANAR